MNLTNFKQEKHIKNANPKGWNEKGKNTKNLKSYFLFCRTKIHAHKVPSKYVRQNAVSSCESVEASFWSVSKFTGVQPTRLRRYPAEFSRTVAEFLRTRVCVEKPTTPSSQGAEFSRTVAEFPRTMVCVEKPTGRSSRGPEFSRTMVCVEKDARRVRRRSIAAVVWCASRRTVVECVDDGLPHVALPSNPIATFPSSTTVVAIIASPWFCS